MSFQPFDKFVLALIYVALFVHNAEGNSCKVKVEKVGCFNDKSRPLNKLFVYRRTTYNHTDQTVELPRLLCDCAVKAHSRGYSYIGLQYYAECWTSSESAPHYSRDGSSMNNCYNCDHRQCSEEDHECVGGALANFIYRIVYSDMLSSPDTIDVTPPTSTEETLHMYSTTLETTEMAQLGNRPPVETPAVPTEIPATPISEWISRTTEPTSFPLEPTFIPLEPTSFPPESTSFASVPTSLTPQLPSEAISLPSETTTSTGIPSPPGDRSPSSETTETTPSTIEPSTEASTKPPCKDKRHNCPSFKNYCLDAYPEMFKECPKTCKRCP